MRPAAWSQAIQVRAGRAKREAMSFKFLKLSGDMHRRQPVTGDRVTLLRKEVTILPRGEDPHSGLHPAGSVVDAPEQCCFGLV